MINKKALSGVVTTVLLILLAIAAVSIVSVNVNTLLKEGGAQLSPAINCLDLQSKSTISIVSSCLNEETSEVEIRLKRGISDGDIIQLDFLLSSDTNSASFCCGIPNCESCAVLNQATQKTYLFPINEDESFSESLISIGSCDLDSKEISICQ